VGAVPSIKDILGWIQHTELAMYISQSGWSFSALEMVHVTATTLIVGMIAIIDLRLIGLWRRGEAVSALYREVIPLTWSAFVVAAITGVMLFSSQAIDYYANVAVRLKFALLALIAVNMLVFRWTVYPTISKWDREGPIPLAARLAGSISLASWMMVVAAARWIAYLRYY
jgi:hypothetical protein